MPARFFLPGVFVLSALLRLLWIGADIRFPHDAFFLTDEGWWLHNARNILRFGSPILDEFNQGLLYAPLYSLYVVVLWSVTGVQLVSARLLSGAAGALTVGIAYLVARRAWGERAGRAAAVVLGLDWLTIRISRLAFPEPLIGLFVMLALWFWMERRHFAAGLAFGLAILTKITAAPMAAVVLLLAVWDWPRRKELTLLAAGLSLPMLPLSWLWWRHWPLVDLMAGVSAHFNMPSSALNLVSNLSQFPSIRVLVQSPVLSVGTWGFLIWRLRSRQALRTLDRLEFGALAWIAGNALFMAPLRFHPDHRYTVLLPAMALLAARWFTMERQPFAGIVQDSTDRLRAGSPWPALLLVFPVAKLLAHALALLVPLPVQALFYSVLFVGLLLLAMYLCHERTAWWAAALVRLPAALSALMWVAVTAAVIQAWPSYVQPTFDLNNLSRTLAAELPAGSTVFGLTADTVALSSGALTVTPRVQILNRDLDRQLQPDYLLVMTEVDGRRVPRQEYFEGNGPLLDLLDRSALVGEYRIGPGRQTPRFILRLYQTPAVEG